MYRVFRDLGFTRFGLRVSGVQGLGLIGFICLEFLLSPKLLARLAVCEDLVVPVGTELMPQPGEEDVGGSLNLGPLLGLLF